MRRKTTIIFLLFSKFLLAYEPIVDNKFCVNTVPLALIDIYGSSSWRIGAEFKIYKNFALSIEGGGYFYNQLNLYSKDHVNGFISRTNFKVYLNRSKITVGPYLSVEHLYKEQSFDFPDSISIDNNPPFLKQYRISKIINCFNINFGDLSIVRKRFIFEWYGGVGIRFINSKSTLTDKEEKGIIDNDDGGFINDVIRATGRFTGPNINVGIKLGYRIL